MKVITIGISGPSCSGKSTASQYIASALPAIVLAQDLYFRDPESCPAEANFCDQQWLHVDEFIRDLLALAAGLPASVPTIDFKTFSRTGTKILNPAPYLVVEGMTIFRIPQVFDLYDQKYYMDADWATIEKRKRDRDARERGKSPNVIDAQLGWMRTEYERDSVLRSRPDITVTQQEDVHQIIYELSGTGALE